MKPVITSMRVSSTPYRKPPKTGDIRTTKKHGVQIRLPDTVEHGHYRGARIVSNGRQLYSWASEADAKRRGYGHLFPTTTTETSTQ